VNRTQTGYSVAASGWSVWAIRRACASDLAALSDFFAALSAQTRYRRFFAAITPTAAMLQVLSGGSCHTDAVIAVQGGNVIGHAMAADRPGADGALMTYIGVVVADAWQGRGVGSALMRALINRARARGVTCMAMDVLHSNHRVLSMITGRWPSAQMERSPDCATVYVRLPQPHRRDGAGALRLAVARADLGRQRAMQGARPAALG
jgi:GNAT superfamily N-acetyltransferase